MLSRRRFLAATAGLATLDGRTASGSIGDDFKPIRETPLKADYWGTQFYDEKELQQLTEVHSKRQPFRWYGPGDHPPSKVATFEGG